MGEAGQSGGRNMETTVLEQQQKNDSRNTEPSKAELEFQAIPTWLSFNISDF